MLKIWGILVSRKNLSLIQPPSDPSAFIFVRISFFIACKIHHSASECKDFHLPFGLTAQRRREPVRGHDP